MGLLRNPLLYRKGVPLCSVPSRRPRTAARRRTAASGHIPPRTAAAAPLPEQHPSSSASLPTDFFSFLRVELTDAISHGSSPETPNALTTERRTVMEGAGDCVLHPCNCAVWTPVLSALHARGAMTTVDRIGAQRFLPPTTFQEVLPWLWSGENALASPSSAAQEEASLGSRLPSVPVTPSACLPGLPPKRALEELRSAAPERWISLVRMALINNEEGSSTHGAADTAEEGLHRIQSWQEVFFAISVNPSFATSTAQLRSAHASLLQVVDMYYADAVAVQQVTAPPRCATSRAGESEGGKLNSQASFFTVTRMPVMLLRQWKKLYRAHFALLDYSELLERVVVGEEAVVAAAEARIAWFLTGEQGYVPPGTFPRHITTALLQDADLFLFYLTIPGRRESGLPWEEQWARTVQHAEFALRRLVTAELVRQPASATLSSTSAPAAAEASETMRKAVGVLMNVCMWVRNNNGEGTRFLQLSRVLLHAYFTTVTAKMGDTAGSAEWLAAGAWALVKALREAAFATMVGKAARLQYACSPGLFDVATAAAALETLRPEEEAVLTARDVHILLHVRKATSAEKVWAAAAHHPCSGATSRYGLLAVGLRLARHLVLASANHTVPRATLRRIGNELRAWCDLVGRPLHLTSGEVAALWHGQVVGGHDSRMTETAWADVLGTGTSKSTWTCGCGLTTSCGPTSSQRAAVSCAACVLRTGVPHSWQCPSCLYTASTGEPTGFCLHCGAAHPGLLLAHPTASSVAVPTAPAAPLSGEEVDSSDRLFVCDECHTCSRLSSPAAGGEGAACAACGSARGYVRHDFVWCCGCGATNDATHAHCWACTRRRAEVVADEEETQEKKLPECPPTIASVAPEGFRPAYRCSFCQHDVSVGRLPALSCASEAASDGALSQQQGPGFYAECPHCRYPHPRHLASLTEGRRVHCPSCDAFVPREADGCDRCHTTSLHMLQPLLVSEADQPWRCHHCGQSNTTTGAASDKSCTGCGVRRVPVTIWELGRRWDCSSCGSGSNFGFACDHCHALAPGLPAAEVHVWRCPVCELTLNPSWDAVCTLPGCGGTPCEDADGAAPPELLSYTPWDCESCGTVNLSRDVAHCCGCGAAVEPKETQLQGTSVLNDRVAAVVPEPARRIAFLSSSAAAAPLVGDPRAPPPHRLGAVERLLAQAADLETGTGVADVTAPTSASTVNLPVEKEHSFSSDARDEEEGWEAVYPRAVMPF